MLRLFGLVIEVLSWIFQVRVVHFQGRLCRIFGKFSLKVDPAGFTLGFRVKFWVGLVTCPIMFYDIMNIDPHSLNIIHL